MHIDCTYLPHCLVVNPAVLNELESRTFCSIVFNMAIGEKCNKIVIDASRSTNLTVTHLTITAAQIRWMHGNLVVAAPQPELRESLLKLSAAEKVEVYDTVADAVARFKPRPSDAAPDSASHTSRKPMRRFDPLMLPAFLETVAIAIGALLLLPLEHQHKEAVALLNPLTVISTLVLLYLIGVALLPMPVVTKKERIMSASFLGSVLMAFIYGMWWLLTGWPILLVGTLLMGMLIFVGFLFQLLNLRIHPGE